MTMTMTMKCTPRNRRLLLPFCALTLLSVLWNGLLAWKHAAELDADRTHPRNDATAKALKAFLKDGRPKSGQSFAKTYSKNSNASIAVEAEAEAEATTLERSDGFGQKTLRSPIQLDAAVPNGNETKIIEHPNNTQKPYFILHVGPPKTATTSIQCGLGDFSIPLALNDSYYFVGKQCPNQKDDIPNGEKQIPGHHLMMGIIYGNPTSRGVEKLQSRMKHHHAMGNNMIFSLEAMAGHLEDKENVWKMFTSLFEGWNLRIVVAYRHYFYWIRSMYFQSYIGDQYLRWPHENNGLPHPSFQEYLGYHLQRWQLNDIDNDDPRAYGQHLSLSTFRKFAKHCEDVKILNLHQGGDPVANFVCQMLPTAHTSCRTLSKRYEDLDGAAATVHRMSHSFDADRLAIAAYEKGLIDGKKIPKKKLVKEIVKYLKETQISTNIDYLQCLPEPLEAQFLNASLTFEREMVADVHVRDADSGFSQNETDHIALFQQAVVRMKFCEIDPALILKNDSWVQFFSRINKT
jgi:hypothetical protein